MVAIDKKESDFLNSVKFICILTIVMVHCSLHDSQYVAPRLIQETIPLVRSWHISLHFGENALGLFFIISGYLFFRSANIESFNWKVDYLNKLKSRVKSLLVIYVVWNTVGLITGYFINKTFPSDILSFLNGYNPFQEGKYFGRGLWFIESLIVFSVISPIYYFSIRCLKHLVPLLCLIFCLTSIKYNYLYFNVYLLMGGYFACMGIKITDVAKLFNWKICLLLIFFIQIFSRSCMIEVNIAQSFTLFLFLAVFMGLLYNRPIPARIAGSSTFVYLAHFYCTLSLKKVLLIILPHGMFGYVSNMLLNCVISASICVLLYVFLISRFNILNFFFAGGRSVRKTT